MKRDHPRTRARRMSYQTIYRWLETCENCGHFRSLLRHGRYRKSRVFDGRGHLSNHVSIDQRPAKVELRRRFGDWKGDTVHGAGHSEIIMTCVERKKQISDHCEDEGRHQCPSERRQRTSIPHHPAQAAPDTDRRQRQGIRRPSTTEPASLNTNLLRPRLLIQ
jgi:IS30 family transposase